MGEVTVSIFEYCPPSAVVFAVVAVAATLTSGILLGAVVVVAWWAGHELDTHGLLR